MSTPFERLIVSEVLFTTRAFNAGTPENTPSRN